MKRRSGDEKKQEERQGTEKGEGRGQDMRGEERKRGRREMR